MLSRWQLPFRYAVYLLYWYKSTNTDTRGAPDSRPLSPTKASARSRARLAWRDGGRPGTHFTCFTGTKVQILTLQLVAQGLREGPATQKLFLLQAAMLQVKKNFCSRKNAQITFLCQYKSTDT